MIVLKFGGTSVGDAERIRAVGSIVREAASRAGPGERPAVVVSAHAGVTNVLFDLARRAVSTGAWTVAPVAERHHAIIDALGLERALVAEGLDHLERMLSGVALLRELTPRSLDAIASLGERMSARIVAAHMRKSGLPARPLDAWDAGLTTDGRFGAARPLPTAEAAIRERLRAVPEVPVITGYIGRTEKGEVTTLGRGGSDYSGAIFGAALGAEEIQIWTDVDGVLSADPKVVKSARILEELSFDEASELATFGAKVLHPATMLPAVEKSIPIRVLNTFNPQARGTRIVAHSGRSAEVVKSIACRKGVRVVNVVSTRMLGVHGFIRRLGEVFDRHEVPIDMMATSEVSVSLTVDDVPAVGAALQDVAQFARVEEESGRAIVCVVGHGLRETRGIAARVFAALARAEVNVLMVSQGASRIDLGLVVDTADADTSVRTLHGEFFGEETRA